MPVINPPVPSDGNNAVAADVDNPVNQIVALLNGGLDTDNFADGGIQLADLAASIQNLLVPVASIVPFAGQVEPTGWVFCYGQSLLRSSFSALFAAIGTNFGSVDGTHFTLPDLRGRVPFGRSNMGGASASRMEHSTTITTTSASASAVVASAAGLARGMFIISTNVPAGTTILTIVGTTITMSANATASASGTAVRFSPLGNDPEVLGASGGADTATLVIDQMPSHTHQQELGGGLQNYAVAAGVGVGGNANFSNVSSTGGDQPHNIVPPALITNYLIKT